MRRRFLLLLVLSLLGTAVFGQDVSKQNERKRQIEEEISFINNQLKSLAGKQKATTEQLTLIQKRVSSRQSLINDLDKRIAVINDEMTAKQREINRLQKELDPWKPTTTSSSTTPIRTVTGASGSCTCFRAKTSDRVIGVFRS